MAADIGQALTAKKAGLGNYEESSNPHKSAWTASRVDTAGTSGIEMGERVRRRLPFLPTSSLMASQFSWPDSVKDRSAAPHGCRLPCSWFTETSATIRTQSPQSISSAQVPDARLRIRACHPASTCPCPTPACTWLANEAPGIRHTKGEVQPACEKV